jgi:hypothetical protein
MRYIKYYLKKNLKPIVYVIPFILFLWLALVGFNNIESHRKPLFSHKTELEVFLDKLAEQESNNNHKVVNEFGMMGKYQFSRTTLRSIRPDVTREEFLNNPHLQDSIVVLYLKSNNKLLRRYIKQYDGRVFKGVKITQSGILAAAHLGGSGSVISWFNSDDHDGLSDANGTTIRQYMVQFSGYKIGKYL